MLNEEKKENVRYNVSADTHQFKYFGPELDTVRRRIKAGFHVALMGAPSTGKTMVARQVLNEEFGDEPGVTWELVVGHNSMTPDDLIGVWTRNAKGELEFVYGPLARAMQAGKPIFVNEFTRMPRKCQNLFVSPLCVLVLGLVAYRNAWSLEQLKVLIPGA